MSATENIAASAQPEAREFTMSQYASKDDMIGAMRKRIAELESELEAIGACGVSGPLIGRAAPPTAQALGCGAEPPGIQALMCVISSLRDIAHFSDEEGGELMSALCALRDWAYAQTAAFQLPPTSAEGVEHG